jgi:hypothetical protein
MLDRPPKMEIRAPVSDSLNTALRRRGILAQDDTAVFAFRPAGDQEVAPLFVVAQRRVIVVALHRLRGYPRDGVSYTLAPRWGVRPRFVFILVSARARPDTVFERLSPRGMWAIARGVEALLPGEFHLGPLRVPGRR